MALLQPHEDSKANPQALDSGPESQKNQEFKLARYVDAEFESEDIKYLIRDRTEKPIHYTDVTHKYRTKDIIPDWIMKTKDWKNTKGKTDGTDISEILQTQPNNRTLEQNSQLVAFLMNVWQTAKQMGIKKCTQMLSEFKYVQYEPKEYIITEGEEGLTFYIIISGTTAVHKAGIGIVARLGKGKAFGELALVKGDVRTASIIAETRVEVLSLHKLDYDHFIKDIQSAERRENFYLLRDCALFASWPRAKIEKLVNTCQRKVVEMDGNIYKQGEDPNSIFVIMDGTVHIIKEVTIETKNFWPTSMNTWSGLKKRVLKPILTNTLHKGDHFGEMAIIKGTPRLDTAIAATKVLLVVLDKLEFLHLVHHDATISNQLQEFTVNSKYPVDDQILKLIGHISGGPTSLAKSGQLTIFPNKIVPLPTPKKLSNERPSTLLAKKIKLKLEKLEKDSLKHKNRESGLDEAQTSIFSDNINKSNYAEKMNTALNADTMLDNFTKKVLATTNTVEKQALKELNAANEILRSATQHKEIEENPLKKIPGLPSRGSTLSLKATKTHSSEDTAERTISFERLEMHDQLRQSIRSPNGCRDPLLAAVVSKSPQNPGVAVRRLKGDEFVPKVVVIKKIPKLPQAFI